MEINISRSFNNAVNNSSAKDFNDKSQYYEQRLTHTIAVCIAVNVLLCLTALLGNAAILVTLWKTPSLHSAANILLRSLALSDLATGLLVQPLHITVLLKRNLGATFQIVFDILTFILCNASFFTTTAIGVDRLLALQLHLRYKTVVTSFRLTGAAALIWVFSGLFSSTRLWISKVFYNALSPILFSLLVVNFGVYLKIYLIVRRHQVQIAHQQQQHQGHESNVFLRLKKSAVNTFLVFILLLFCYVPRSLAIVSLEGGGFSYSNVNIITATVLFLNSSLNPLLYCWRIREIRTAMKHHFCC